MPSPKEIADIKAALAEVEQQYAQSPITRQFLGATSSGAPISKPLAKEHSGLEYLLDMAKQNADAFISGSSKVDFSTLLEALHEYGQMIVLRGEPTGRSSKPPKPVPTKSSKPKSPRKSSPKKSSPKRGTRAGTRGTQVRAVDLVIGDVVRLAGAKSVVQGLDQAGSTVTLQLARVIPKKGGKGRQSKLTWTTEVAAQAWVPLAGQRASSTKSERLVMDIGEEDWSATRSLRMAALTAKSRGDLSSAVISAGFYAKKQGKTMYVYSGNSYGSAVWRVSDKPGEYLDPINNTGARLLSVDPDLLVSWHNLDRPGAVDQRQQEMQDLLRRFGYDPASATVLRAEGMGPGELAHILTSTRPGDVGSLEYTHRIFKLGSQPSTILRIDDPEAIYTLAGLEGPNWYRDQEKDKRKLANTGSFWSNRAAYAVLVDMGKDAKDLIISDILPEAGFIHGSHGELYAVLPDGQIALIADTASPTKQAAAAAYMLVA